MNWWPENNPSNTDPTTGLPQTVPLVLLSASFAQDVFLPSNVWLYDATLPDSPVRLAAVSATSSAVQAGVVLRMAVKGQYLYTSASQQGLQAIDLQQVVSEYKTTSAGDFGQAISTDGGGFAMDAIINDIQLPIPGGGTATMFGLQADDFVVSGGGSGSSAATQTLLVATGQLPLVVADPARSGLSAVVYPPNSSGALNQISLSSLPGSVPSYQLQFGRAVALATIPVTDNSGNSSNKHIAVVVGTSTPGTPLLAVVDMTQPYTPGSTVPCDPNATSGSPNCPKAIGFLPLLDQNGQAVTATDVAINGTTALVATGTNVLLVNLADPYHPTAAGQITGSFGNWLAITSSGLIVGSLANTGGSPDLHSSFLGEVAYVSSYYPNPIPLLASQPPQTNPNAMLLAQDVQLTHVVVPPDPAVTSDRVDILNDLGVTVSSFPGALNSGQGVVTWPKGTVVDVSRKYSAQVYAVKNGLPIQTFPVTLNLACSIANLQVLALDKNGIGQPKVAMVINTFPDMAGTPQSQANVTFMIGLTANCPVHYQIDYGDGSPVVQADGGNSSTHTYTKVGIFKPSFQASCASCGSTLTSSVEVDVVALMITATIKHVPNINNALGRAEWLDDTIQRPGLSQALAELGSTAVPTGLSGVDFTCSTGSAVTDQFVKWQPIMPATNESQAPPPMTQSSNTAHIPANQRGSFDLSCFYDVNNDGVMQDNEPQAFFNIVFVSVHVSSFFANVGAIQQDVTRESKNLFVLSAGEPAKQNDVIDWGSPDSDGVHFTAVLQLAGGGPDQSVGVDLMNYGLLQNITSDTSQAYYNNNKKIIDVDLKQPGSFNNYCICNGDNPGLWSPPYFDQSRTLPTGVEEVFPSSLYENFQSPTSFHTDWSIPLQITLQSVDSPNFAMPVPYPCDNVSTLLPPPATNVAGTLNFSLYIVAVGNEMHNSGVTYGVGNWTVDWSGTAAQSADGTWTWNGTGSIVSPPASKFDAGKDVNGAGVMVYGPTPYGAQLTKVDGRSNQ